MSQYSPIWDAIDEEQWPYALDLIERAQKRSRKPDKTLLGLQGLCLAKERRIEQALSVCEQIKTLAPKAVSTYETIHDVLKTSPLPEFTDYLVKTMEYGYKEIKSEVMGRMWFMEAVRGGRLNAQRRAAVELQKVFLAREYFYLVLMSMLLLYSSSQTGKERDLTGMLMYRMICKAASNPEPQKSLASNGSSSGPRIGNVEEFYVYLDILRALDKGSEALDALDSPLGELYANNHEFALLRVELIREVHGAKHPKMQDFTRNQVEKGVDDWILLQACIDSLEYSDEKSLNELLDQRIRQSTSRNGRLAYIYATSRLKDTTPMLNAIKNYLESFGDKSAAFEDLAPFLKQLNNESASSLIAWLRLDRGDHRKVIQSINFAKVEVQLGLVLDADDSSVDLVQGLLQAYKKALVNKPESEENQSADDSLLLACHILVQNRSDSTETLKVVALLLEYGLSFSKHNFQFRLSLIGVYRKLGAWSAAQKHFAVLSVKQIQRDTLSYVLYEDSIYEYVSSMQMTGLKSSQNIYWSNEQETPEMICQAYEKGIYSKIAELLLFQKRLRKSSWSIESKIALYRLQMMLDKFEWSSKLLTEFPLSQPLYDNKSRNVQMLYQGRTIENNDSDKILSTAGFRKLQNSLQTCAMVQAIVKNIRLDETILSQNVDLDPIDFLVSKLYLIKFGTDSTAIEQLKTFVADLSVPTIEEVLLTSESLHMVGINLEILKIYSIALPHLKSSQTALKHTTETLRHLHEQLRGRLESCRRNLATSSIALDTSLVDIVGIPAASQDATSKIIRASQTEGVTCLLGLAKNIKL